LHLSDLSGSIIYRMMYHYWLFNFHGSKVLNTFRILVFENTDFTLFINYMFPHEEMMLFFSFK